jgi:hypothetical protein
MSSKESREWETAETPLDRELDALLTDAIQLSVPDGLMDRALSRLPEERRVPLPWWAWGVYVAFFATAVAGLAYWEQAALISLASSAVLTVPKAVALAAQYPYWTLTVAGAFFINALVGWLVAADLVLRKRLAGVMAS